MTEDNLSDKMTTRNNIIEAVQSSTSKPVQDRTVTKIEAEKMAKCLKEMRQSKPNVSVTDRTGLNRTEVNNGGELKTAALPPCPPSVDVPSSPVQSVKRWEPKMKSLRLMKLPPGIPDCICHARTDYLIREMKNIGFKDLRRGKEVIDRYTNKVKVITEFMGHKIIAYDPLKKIVFINCDDEEFLSKSTTQEMCNHFYNNGEYQVLVWIGKLECMVAMDNEGE
jgi:hypothetical protein